MILFKFYLHVVQMYFKEGLERFFFFQCQHQQWVIRNRFNGKFAEKKGGGGSDRVFHFTIANADIGSLKLIDKKWLTIFDKALTPFQMTFL